ASSGIAPCYPRREPPRTRRTWPRRGDRCGRLCPRPDLSPVDQGGEVGEVRPQEPTAPAGLAAVAVPLRNGPL
ncbi:MAG: hypothetical protein AVDCRST_MAG28-2810, partial [uncultured Rubrobacteraceae bacterium]